MDTPPAHPSLRPVPGGQPPRRQPVVLALVLVLFGITVVVGAGGLAAVWWHNRDLLDKERTLHRIALDRAQTVEAAVAEVAGERRCRSRDQDLLLGRFGVGDAIARLCDDLTPQMFGEQVVGIVVRDGRARCEGAEDLTVDWFTPAASMRESLTTYLEARPELCAGT